MFFNKFNELLPLISAWNTNPLNLPVSQKPEGVCICGGNIYMTTVSKKFRCNKCGKVGRFKVEEK